MDFFPFTKRPTSLADAVPEGFRAGAWVAHWVGPTARFAYKAEHWGTPQPDALLLVPQVGIKTMHWGHLPPRLSHHRAHYTAFISWSPKDQLEVSPRAHPGTVSMVPLYRIPSSSI